MAKRWYSVSVLSNYEKKIAEAINLAVIDKGLAEDFDEVLVPTEEVIEIRRGKKVTAERRFHARLRAGTDGDVGRGLSPCHLNQPRHWFLGPARAANANARRRSERDPQPGRRKR